MDRDPAAHTLLLLASGGIYHKEVMRNTNMDDSHIRTTFIDLED